MPKNNHQSIQHFSVLSTQVHIQAQAGYIVLTARERILSGGPNAIRAYWLQDESLSFVYDNVSDVAAKFGYSLPKVTGIVTTHCRACTRRRCKSCGEPVRCYRSRSEQTYAKDPHATRCLSCARG